MRIVIFSPNQDVRAQFARQAAAWCQVSCVRLEIVLWEQLPFDTAEGGIFLLDFTGWKPSAVEHPLVRQLSRRTDCALFLCPPDSRAAIRCYPLHPTGLLRKPLRMEDLCQAMNRCIHLWWDCLERLELLSDRMKVQIPLFSLVWAESVPKGCLLHCANSQVLVRIPLSALQKLLPESHFFRCQRSFLCNLFHLNAVEKEEILLSDGARLPLGRGQRTPLLEACHAARSMQSGQPRRKETAL